MGCATRKPGGVKRRGPLKPIIVGYPLQLVAVDIMGPLPETSNGNKYILVAEDYFTRWLEAWPIPNQETKTVAEKLLNEMFFRFSIPDQILSDQDRQFESALITELCNVLQIQKSRTTPYHPQADGLVERSNRTLLSMLSIVVDEHPQTWESHLRAVCMAYNTSIQPTTGYSHFFLMFGRKARLPIDIMYGTGQADNFAVDRFVNDVSVVLENAYQHVRNTMGFKQDRQKELYDCKRHGEFYKAGDLVWLHSPVVPRGASRKLHRPWTGPYKIIKRLADVTYRIQNCNGRRRRRRLVVHFDRLKPCRQDMRMEGSSSDRITASHTASKDAACEPSVLPTVHDSEDDFIEDSVNNNTEGDMLEEHCSHSTDAVIKGDMLEEHHSDSTDAATTPLEVDSDLYQDPTQQELPKEHDHVNSDSPQLAMGDITSVPPTGSSDAITHTDADLHRYPRRSHRPPQRYADYVSH